MAARQRGLLCGAVCYAAAATSVVYLPLFVGLFGEADFCWIIYCVEGVGDLAARLSCPAWEEEGPAAHRVRQTGAP